ncbi:MAG: dihydropteroate synthase [Cytophagales bacterium]|jgi:dihydropteroate synthase|nr:dihydropteroate synthase [Cytophagales bacterium]
MLIGTKKFTEGTHVMAIINITPDSFFPDSRLHDLDQILRTVEKFINGGAEIIDIGGQSTRPCFEIVPWEEELERILKPVIEIKKRFDIPISIDTFYSQVAEEVLKEGVGMINDVFGLEFDPNMVHVIAKYDAAVCLVHNSRNKKDCQNTLEEIIEFLQVGVKKCLEDGVDENKICLDGGIGFGKTSEQNWNLLNNYEKLHILKLPLLLGTSRKSFLGGMAEDRLQITLETTKLAMKKKIMFIRVHDVAENFNTIKNFESELC